MPGNHNSGRSSERLNAVETAKARRWNEGSRLRSKEWSCDVRIVEIQDKFLKVRRIGMGSSPGSIDRVRTLPADVTRVGPSERPKPVE